MADVYYPGIAAGDAAAVTETGVVSAIVTPNATYQVFELTDSAYSTPLTIKTPSGLERTDVPVGDLPIFPDVYVVSPNFAHNWVSGDLVFRRDSDDAKDQAVADAVAAAQEAAGVAAAGAATELAARIAAGEFNGLPGRDGSNVVPTAEAIATEIQTPGTPANTALSATIEQRTAEINVVTKGAKLDGVADDRPAFQAAMDSASTFGLGVFFPPGTARLGASLVPKSGVTVRGSGSSSIITATTEIGAAFFNQTADLSDFTIRDLTIRGRATDLNQPRRRSRPLQASISQAIRFIGSGYNGVVPNDTNSYPTIKNIGLDNVRLVNISSLPFFFAGVTNVSVRNSFIRNCMDPGFVYVDGVDFSHNTVENSADNGVSVSRECRNVTIADNVIRGSAHYGVWCAGFWSDADGGIKAAGPDNFTVTGNKVYDSGMGGIALSDAPRFGVVADNVVIGVTNGNQDAPSPNYGIGIYVTGYPLQNATPEQWAEQIIIANNLIKDCARNGIQIRGARDVQIHDNTFIDIGVANFAADDAFAGIVAGTPVSSTSVSYNCAISTSGTPNERVSVVDNTFIDTRATALSNYAIPANVRSGVGFHEAGNRAYNYRQPLGQILTSFGETNGTGYTLALNSGGGVNKDLAFQTNGVGRWFIRQATDNTLQIVRRNTDGSLASYPLTINWINGEITTSHSVVLGGGAYLQNGQILDVGSGTGGKIGGAASKMAFFGATPIAKPSLTYSRTGEPEAIRQMRLALVDLGLISNNTVN